MNNFFTDVGIKAVDFVRISSLFVLTMAAFFGLPEKHMWLSYFLTVSFALICLTTMLSARGLNTRLFAMLMLLSLLIVEGVVSWRKKHERSKGPNQLTRN